MLCSFLQAKEWTNISRAFSRLNSLAFKNLKMCASLGIWNQLIKYLEKKTMVIAIKKNNKKQNENTRNFIKYRCLW